MIKKKSKNRKYKCHICRRDIDEKVALTHIKTEEYLIDLIRKNHPEWKLDKALCKHCVDYYRTLIKKAEI